MLTAPNIKSRKHFRGKIGKRHSRRATLKSEERETCKPAPDNTEELF